MCAESRGLRTQLCGAPMFRVMELEVNWPIFGVADDTVVLGLISNNDETAYLDEVERLTSWCQDNCLSLNVSKTKELIVDFRKRQQRPYTPLIR